MVTHLHSKVVNFHAVHAYTMCSNWKDLYRHYHFLRGGGSNVAIYAGNLQDFQRGTGVFDSDIWNIVVIEKSALNSEITRFFLEWFSSVVVATEHREVPVHILNI